MDKVQSSLRHAVWSAVFRAGYEIRRRPAPTPEPEYPPDFDRAAVDTIEAVRSYTMTTPERIFAICEAVRYVAAHAIPGAIVECGVWRGGSMMAVARTLLEQGDVTRDLWLYDTFEGMVEPAACDVRFDGVTAADVLAREGERDEESVFWAYTSLDKVRTAVASVGYPTDRIHFVPGRVEDTIPGTIPERIAILRLDTDWYESTSHELVHLFPRLGPHGVLILDDYGFWRGARQAADEYLHALDKPVFLTRVDESCRVAVVP